MKNIILLFLLLCLSIVTQAQEYIIHSEKVDKDALPVERLYEIGNGSYVTLNKKVHKFEICTQKFSEKKATCYKVEEYNEMWRDKYKYIGIHIDNKRNSKVFFYKNNKTKLLYYYCNLDLKSKSLGKPILFGEIVFNKNRWLKEINNIKMLISENNEHVAFVLNATSNSLITPKYKFDLWCASYHLETEIFSTEFVQLKYSKIRGQQFFVSNNGKLIRIGTDLNNKEKLEIEAIFDTMVTPKIHLVSLNTDNYTLCKNNIGTFELFLLSNDGKDYSEEVVFNKMIETKNGFEEISIDISDPLIQEVLERDELYLFDIHTTKENNTYVIFQTTPIFSSKKAMLLFGKIEDNKVKVLFQKKVKKDERFSLARTYDFNDGVIFLYLDSKADTSLFKTNYGMYCLYSVDEDTDEVKHCNVDKDFAKEHFLGRMESISFSSDNNLMVLYINSGSSNRNLIFIRGEDTDEVIRM